MDVRVAVVLVLALACVQASSLYYGRCFGTVHSWERVDKGSSHHLEVYFNTVKDLDTGASYEAFAANVDIRSHVRVPWRSFILWLMSSRAALRCSASFSTARNSWMQALRTSSRPQVVSRN